MSNVKDVIPNWNEEQIKDSELIYWKAKLENQGYLVVEQSKILKIDLK